MPPGEEESVINAGVMMNISLYTRSKRTIDRFKKYLDDKMIKLIREEYEFMDDQVVFPIVLKGFERIDTPCRCEITLIDPEIVIMYDENENLGYVGFGKKRMKKEEKKFRKLVFREE